MRARYYSPTLKRFINADVVAGSITNAITLNRYAYANGNPVSNVDPFGLSADSRGSQGTPIGYGQTNPFAGLRTEEVVIEEPMQGYVENETTDVVESNDKWGWLKKAGAVAAVIGITAVFVVATAASAGAVGFAVGYVAASFGASSAVISTAMTVGTVGTYVVAGGTGAFGLSDAGEIITGHNVIRDNIMGGNQEAYDATKTLLSFASMSAITIGASNPGIGNNNGRTTIYRSVSNNEKQDIKKTGQFNLPQGGMEAKQFGFSKSETIAFGKTMRQTGLVSAKVPTNSLSNYYLGGEGGIDSNIFRSGTLTVYDDQLLTFNKSVEGTIRILR